MLAKTIRFHPQGGPEVLRCEDVEAAGDRMSHTGFANTSRPINAMRRRMRCMHIRI